MSAPGTAPRKPLSLTEMQSRARKFVIEWTGESRENAESQSWWNDYFHIFGVERRRMATYERWATRASTGRKGRIDVFMPGVMIAEHKSLGKDKGKGSSQADDYLRGGDIPAHEYPRYIVSTDFETITLDDLESGDPPLNFSLKDLPKYVQRFAFLAGYEAPKRQSDQAESVSIKAAQEMGELYDALLGDTPTDPESKYAEDASIFMTRLLFLLYGDDVVGLWEEDLFESFIKNNTAEDGSDTGPMISHLFQVLDSAPDSPMRRHLPAHLAAFPHVNGGLFKKRIDIPAFDRRMREALIKAVEIDWSGISPAIFGSLFQGMSSREERRKGGEHYTTETNILKTLRPLFLDELEERLQRAWASTSELEKLRNEIATYRYLDPACGCGNFLIIAYREMADLEYRIIKQLRALRGETNYVLDTSWGLKVRPEQFGGIEISWWPAKIAETAMFLMQHKVTQRLGEMGDPPTILPIQEAAHIVHGDALATDWNDAMPVVDRTFVFGNPPFHGHKERSNAETASMKRAWGTDYNGNLDFVTSWHAKTLDYLGKRENSRFAFVTTNSICQGQSVEQLFRPIYRDAWRISFAHRTFAWTSESTGAAAVHCVIVGFDKGSKPPRLFNYPKIKGKPVEISASHISAYLIDMEDVFVPARDTPLSPALTVVSSGSNPIDFKQFLLDTNGFEEVQTDPIASKYLRRFSNGSDYINGDERWCLWLKDASVEDLEASPVLLGRVKQLAAKRSESLREATRKLARTPTLFGEDRQPIEPFLGFPQTFTENRRYMTVGYMDPSIIIGMKIYSTIDPDGLQFAIASSSMMITWQFTVGGRLKSDPSFSNTLVWNTFPLRELKQSERARIIAGGKAVIAARERHAGKTLAELYNPYTMPKDLLSAHDSLDKAVDAVFGFRRTPTEMERQKRLFDRYISMTAAAGSSVGSLSGTSTHGESMVN